MSKKVNNPSMVMSGAQLCCPNHLLSRSFGYEMGEPIGNKMLEGESVRGGTRGLHKSTELKMTGKGPFISSDLIFLEKNALWQLRHYFSLFSLSFRRLTFLLIFFTAPFLPRSQLTQGSFHL